MADEDVGRPDEGEPDVLPSEQQDENLKTIVEKIKKQDLTPTGRIVGI